MPLDELLVFRTALATVPLKDWLGELNTTEPRAYAKCLERINHLQQFGNQVKMPRAKILRDGIWELRAKSGQVHYRIIFFFCGKPGVMAACMTHGFKKGGKGASEDPNNAEIESAVKCRALVLSDRERYTADWEQ
jgi:putative component of toxin-antitoxin plasmid stabilization module